jgi:hypothetical protein
MLVWQKRPKFIERLGSYYLSDKQELLATVRLSPISPNGPNIRMKLTAIALAPALAMSSSFAFAQAGEGDASFASAQRGTNHDRLHLRGSVFDFELREDEMAAIQTLARPHSRIVNPTGLAPVWDAS